MYNLLYYQIVTQLCVNFSDKECEYIIRTYGKSSTPKNYKQKKNPNPNQYLGRAIALVLNHTNRLVHLRLDSMPSTSAASSNAKNKQSTKGGRKNLSSIPSSLGDNIDLKSLENQLQTLCLPYLRIAALLRLHLYHQDMPEIPAPHLEFVRLVYYLELVTDSMDWELFNASKALCFIPETEESLPRFWCEQLLTIRPPIDALSELAMISQHVAWQQPKLLDLPREYERLFTVTFYISSLYKIFQEQIVSIDIFSFLIVLS